MRLYRMELYKLYHKKAFAIWSALTILIMVLYFCMMVSEQISTVDEVTYYGYDAVRIDRKITEAYRGGLTDEKVQQIVKEYGLPSKVEYDYGGWRDANYLNGFVTKYLSDGDNRNWNDYRVPTMVYDIADTELGKLQEILGQEIPFAYTVGWRMFFDTLEAGMILASILVVITVSVVFSQESQTGMLSLLFTAQEGKEKDTWAKIVAAFTLTVIVYGVVVLLALLLCVCTFGMDGAGCPLSVAVPNIMLNVNLASNYMPVSSFGWVIIGFNLLAMLLLCAITLCVSAYCRSAFGAVTAAAALWGLPFLIRILCGGFGYFFTSCMPIFLIGTRSVYESVSWGITVPTIAVGLGLFIACVEEGYRVYKRQAD